MARRPRPHPKGRQLDPVAATEITALLEGKPRRRDLLIEYLHAVQDRYRGLSKPHLHALAAELNLPMAEVYEVASFYHHFDILADGERPAPVTVRVCTSPSCRMAGAETLRGEIKAFADPDEVRVVAAPCIGRCDRAPAALVGRNAIAPADRAAIAAALSAGEIEARIRPYRNLAAYRAAGGYRVLAECRDGSRSLEDIIAVLSDAGLRGLGGAGFPAGRKWRIVRQFPGPRYVTVNADEGEPGTFKDRHYLEVDPHRVLEGALIAATTIAAERVFVYLRDEYPHLHEILRREIAALEADGLIAPSFIELRRGAGAYVCGEESAMLESIEGKRGLPRHRPPFIAEAGLSGRPTLNHNVETLYWVPQILAEGASWFADQGKPGHPGLRSYSVSGRVRDPGVKCAPAGISLAELIDHHCGGMAEGHTLKAFLPGGASGGIFPAEMADMPLDFGSFEPHGGFIGSHAVIVLSDRDDIADIAHNLIGFFAAESCGQCTPCRVGTEKMAALIEAGTWDEALLGDLAAVLRDASICGLGQAAPNCVITALRYFLGDDTPAAEAT